MICGYVLSPTSYSDYLFINVYIIDIGLMFVRACVRAHACVCVPASISMIQGGKCG